MSKIYFSHIRLLGDGNCYLFFTGAWSDSKRWSHFPGHTASLAVAQDSNYKCRVSRTTGALLSPNKLKLNWTELQGWGCCLSLCYWFFFFFLIFVLCCFTLAYHKRSSKTQIGQPAFHLPFVVAYMNSLRPHWDPPISFYISSFLCTEIYICCCRRVVILFNNALIKKRKIQF